MKYLPQIVFFLIICVLLYSLYLFLDWFSEHKKIKQLKSLYPSGFIYKNEAYFTSIKHGKLPIIAENHIKLLESIDISNIEKEIDGKVCLKIDDPTSYY